jgi:hypothetical protein
MRTLLPNRDGENTLGTGAVPTALPFDDLDMRLVAQIVERAGVPCLLETTDERTTAILAEPRLHDGQPRWSVRATRVRGPDHDHVRVGPDADHARAVQVRRPDERRLAAYIVAQALRDRPDDVLTFAEVDALGLE